MAVINKWNSQPPRVRNAVKCIERRIVKKIKVRLKGVPFTHLDTPSTRGKLDEAVMLQMEISATSSDCSKGRTWGQFYREGIFQFTPTLAPLNFVSIPRVLGANTEAIVTTMLD
jgi:hypothetical protein